MNPLDLLKTTCKNCGTNHFLYNKEYQCHTCKKVICKSCSYGLDKHLYKNIPSRECFECNNKKSKAIRKMIAVESGIIKEYKIVNESNGVVNSPYFSEPNLAIENLKHLALIKGYSAITFLKIDKAHISPKSLANFSGSKFREYNLITGYYASGILVVVKKQP